MAHEPNRQQALFLRYANRNVSAVVLDAHLVTYTLRAATTVTVPATIASRRHRRWLISFIRSSPSRPKVKENPHNSRRV